MRGVGIVALVVPNRAARKRRRAVGETTIAEDNIGATVHLQRPVAIVRRASRRVVVVVSTGGARATKVNLPAVALRPNFHGAGV